MRSSAIEKTSIISIVATADLVTNTLRTTKTEDDLPSVIGVRQLHI
jgi:hypothetical protein